MYLYPALVHAWFIRLHDPAGPTGPEGAHSVQPAGAAAGQAWKVRAGGSDAGLRAPSRLTSATGNVITTVRQKHILIQR